MKSAALSNTLSPHNVSPSISTSLILTEFLYRFLSTYHWPFSCSGMTVLLKSGNRIPGANILGVVKGTCAISSCISKEPINLCTEWTHRFFFFVFFFHASLSEQPQGHSPVLHCTSLLRMISHVIGTCALKNGDFFFMGTPHF